MGLGSSSKTVERNTGFTVLMRKKHDESLFNSISAGMNLLNHSENFFKEGASGKLNS